jgi:hypothetical protein
MVKVIRVNGNVIYDLGGVQLPLIDEKEARRLDRAIAHLKRNRRAYMAVCYALALALLPHTAFAAATAGSGLRLLRLVQQGAFWGGIIVTIWGIVEAWLDWPDWKGRVLKGIIGYILILLVPLLFLELDASLGVDVWNELQQRTGVRAK